MIDVSKLTDENIESSELQEEQSIFSFQNLFAMLVLNWQWFLLSLFICACTALIYLRYATPNYQVSAKMLIKDEDNRRRPSANQMLANMQDIGFMTNSAGIENEVEILQSRILAHDAVKDLKLYVQYYNKGRVKTQLAYKTQPFCVQPDSVMLEKWDKDLLECMRSIRMNVTKTEKGYEVEGELLKNGKATATFTKEFAKLPAVVRTKYGVLTFTQNTDIRIDEGEDKTSTLDDVTKTEYYVVQKWVLANSKRDAVISNDFKRYENPPAINLDALYESADLRIADFRIKPSDVSRYIQTKRGGFPADYLQDACAGYIKRSEIDLQAVTDENGYGMLSNGDDIGSVHVNFAFETLESAEPVTVIGRQSGDRIVFEDDELVSEAERVRPGTVSREEFLKWEAKLPEGAWMVFYDGDPWSCSSGWRDLLKTNQIQVAFSSWRNITDYRSYDDYDVDYTRANYMTVWEYEYEKSLQS